MNNASSQALLGIASFRQPVCKGRTGIAIALRIGKEGRPEAERVRGGGCRDDMTRRAHDSGTAHPQKCQHRWKPCQPRSTTEESLTHTTTRPAWDRRDSLAFSHMTAGPSGSGLGMAAGPPVDRAWGALAPVLRTPGTRVTCYAKILSGGLLVEGAP